MTPNPRTQEPDAWPGSALRVYCFLAATDEPREHRKDPEDCMERLVFHYLARYSASGAADDARRLRTCLEILALRIELGKLYGAGLPLTPAVIPLRAKLMHAAKDGVDLDCRTIPIKPEGHTFPISDLRLLRRMVESTARDAQQAVKNSLLKPGHRLEMALEIWAKDAYAAFLEASQKQPPDTKAMRKWGRVAAALETARKLQGEANGLAAVSPEDPMLRALQRWLDDPHSEVILPGGQKVWMAGAMAALQELGYKQVGMSGGARDRFASGTIESEEGNRRNSDFMKAYESFSLVQDLSVESVVREMTEGSQFWRSLREVVRDDSPFKKYGWKAWLLPPGFRETYYAQKLLFGIGEMASQFPKGPGYFLEGMADHWVHRYGQLKDYYGETGGGILASAVMLADQLGLTGIGEGFLRVDTMTGRPLEDWEANDRLAEGMFNVGISLLGARGASKYTFKLVAPEVLEGAQVARAATRAELALKRADALADGARAASAVEDVKGVARGMPERAAGILDEGPPASELNGHRRNGHPRPASDAPPPRQSGSTVAEIIRKEHGNGKQFLNGDRPGEAGGAVPSPEPDFPVRGTIRPGTQADIIHTRRPINDPLPVEVGASDGPRTTAAQAGEGTRAAKKDRPIKGGEGGTGGPADGGRRSGAGVGGKPEGDNFIWEWRTKAGGVELSDVRVKKGFRYTRKPRKKYDKDLEEAGPAKKKWLQSIARDPEAVRMMKKAGIPDKEIEDMLKGDPPDGWQVHHVEPLDDNGTNAPENFVLMKNQPAHRAITAAINTAVEGMVDGETRLVDLPMPDSIIYPPHPKMVKEW